MPHVARNAVAVIALTAIAALGASVFSSGVGRATTTATRGQLLYATTFDPASFNQQVVGSSASLAAGPGPSLQCGVGSSGSKMIASVAGWSITEPASIWAEETVSAAASTGDLQSGFYFEGLGANHRHLHIDFGANQIVLRDPNYHNEGPVVSVPGLSSGSSFQFIVIASSPRYQVFVNGNEVIDYTDSSPASTPGGFGFDCADASGTGGDSITELSLYSVGGACGTGWVCEDIGNPAMAGSSTLSGGTWSVQGGGADIFGTADQFQFASQTLSGNGLVSACVTSQTVTSSWAKAGVMLRLSADPGSPYYALFITPGNGIEMQYRSAENGTTSSKLFSGALPAYLEVVRSSGDIFNAYTSSDGATWQLLPGTKKTLSALSGQLLAGLAVTAHKSGALSTATFTGVTIQ